MGLHLAPQPQPWAVLSQKMGKGVELQLFSGSSVAAALPGDAAAPQGIAHPGEQPNHALPSPPQFCLSRLLLSLKIVFGP